MQLNTTTAPRVRRPDLAPHKAVQHEQGRAEMAAFLDQCDSEWEMYRTLRSQGYSQREANAIMARRRIGLS